MASLTGEGTNLPFSGCSAHLGTFICKEPGCLQGQTGISLGVNYH